MACGRQGKQEIIRKQITSVTTMESPSVQYTLILARKGPRNRYISYPLRNSNGSHR
jgi:hypothetical protein